MFTYHHHFPIIVPPPPYWWKLSVMHPEKESQAVFVVRVDLEKATIWLNVRCRFAEQWRSGEGFARSCSWGMGGVIHGDATF
jgi:hypothetical protein